MSILQAGAKNLATDVDQLAFLLSAHQNVDANFLAEGRKPSGVVGAELCATP